MELYDILKSRYENAEIRKLDGDQGGVEILFPKADVPVIINKNEENDRFSIDYPKLTSVLKNGKVTNTEHRQSSGDCLMEGVLWVLKKVRKHGRVLPEIME